MRILKKYTQFNLEDSLYEDSNDNVRVRFAPSPTGALHIGGVRTALYNYLFAKKHNGKIILRIEDTDSTRFVQGSEKYIEDSFNWLGIEFDESPTKGGSYGPYKQSERKDIYKKYAQELISDGKAYYAFDTSSNLDKAREDIPNFSYNFETRGSMKNSLTLSKEETNRLLRNNRDWVIRIKYPDDPINIVVDDLIRGKVTVNSKVLDDKVIWKKKDELPTYHLANIVDDNLMKISHVIRGEEWLPSAPLHVYLYHSLGWKSPKFAHLPLILGPKGKLSKRDGDKYGFPVYPLNWIDPNNPSITSLGFKESGYTPEAVVNLLAFIGWNPGTEKEIYTMDELIDDFDIKRINKAGGKFNPVKAAWFNGQWLKKTPTDELIPQFKKVLDEKNIKRDYDFIYKVVENNKGRVNFIEDLFNSVSYLFEKPTHYDEKALRKWTNKSKGILDSFQEKLDILNKFSWNVNYLQGTFQKYVDTNKIKYAEIVPILRVALTGQLDGPSIFEIMEMLGKQEVMDRLDDLDDFEAAEEKHPDFDGEKEQRKIKLNKELGLNKGSLIGAEKKLGNEKFVSRAPAKVIEDTKQKVIDLKLKISEIEKELSELSIIKSFENFKQYI